MLRLELEGGLEMDVSLDVRKFLRARRDRAVGSILGYAEAEIRPKLDKQQWEALRRVVLEATNSYHDTVLDLVKTEDVARNDHIVSLLERMDRNLTSQSRAAVAESDRLHEESKRAIVDRQAKFEADYEGGTREPEDQLSAQA